MDIRGLGYIGIETTDMAKWKTFGTDILGMMIAPNMPDNGDLYLKMDEYPYRFRIFNGEQDRFAHAGWEVPGVKAFKQACQELEAAGISFERGTAEEADQRQVRELIRFTAPGGMECEIYYNLKLDYAPLISPVGLKKFVTGYNGDMGLGHLAVATPELEASHQFFTEVMGFGQTDYMHFNFSGQEDDPGQGLHFMHCNNPRHHSLALFDDQNPHPGNLVHLMVEVESLDDVGRFMDRIQKHDIRVITGLGRHTNDQMVSIYVESPAGFALEFGYDGVQIDWENYTPTESSVTSFWGHSWGKG